MLETIEPLNINDNNGIQMPATTTNGNGQTASGLNDSQLKLKIITTQIPQSLLIPNSNSNNNNTARTLEAVERYRG